MPSGCPDRSCNFWWLRAGRSQTGWMCDAAARVQWVAWISRRCPSSMASWCPCSGCGAQWTRLGNEEKQNCSIPWYWHHRHQGSWAILTAPALLISEKACVLNVCRGKCPTLALGEFVHVVWTSSSRGPLSCPLQILHSVCLFFGVFSFPPGNTLSSPLFFWWRAKGFDLCKIC